MSAKVIALRIPAPERVELSDEALLAACALADQTALAILYRRHHPALYRFLSRLVGARSAELEDLVQLTFLGAWKSAAAFRAQSTVRSWLFGIGANIARKHHRSEFRRKSAFDWLAQRFSRGPLQPEEIVSSGELIDRLAQAVEALPHDLRVAYVMCEVEEVPGVEAAKALGVRPGTMWRRLHHARKALRSAIEAGEVQ